MKRTWTIIGVADVVGACQRRMLVVTPLVETEQDRSIRVEDLPEVVVSRSRRRQAK